MREDNQEYQYLFPPPQGGCHDLHLPLPNSYRLSFLNHRPNSISTHGYTLPSRPCLWPRFEPTLTPSMLLLYPTIRCTPR